MLGNMKLYFSCGTGFRTLINNSRRKFETEKLIFNQYLGMGGRLQPNFANFNLDFLLKYR